MFSRAVGREGHCRQMSLACVGSISSVLATPGLPSLTVCGFPIYTAQAPGFSPGSGAWVACASQAEGAGFRGLHKDRDSVGPAVCAFPARAAQSARSTLPGCNVPSPLRGPSLSFWACRFGAPCICSGELDSSCDRLGGCRPSRISGSLWLEAGSLFAVW